MPVHGRRRAATRSSAFVVVCVVVASACSEGATPPDVVRSRSGVEVATSTLPPIVTVPPAGAPTVEEEPVETGEISRSRSVGDPRLPDLGSADIDVARYVVALLHDRDAGTLSGVVEVELTTVAVTDQVALDAEGLDVASVTVDGSDRAFALEDRELVIELGESVPAGTALSVEVAY
ncbi:MAG: hypothetical protein HKN41_13295, partial [Ilumatobacter sp.]|nr:hypothetical protein [Ilumatobacter sp.]